VRFLPLLLICATFVAACGAERSASDGLARLTVRVDADGAKGPDHARSLKLDCASAAQSATCAAAAKVTPAELAPTPGGVACTQIYGGPQTATIAGTLRGKPVDASFSRVNGCETARWGHVQPLLDGAR
jgi:hypothetical protein